MREELIHEIKDINYITKKEADRKKQYSNPLMYSTDESFLILNSGTKKFRKKSEISDEEITDQIFYRDITDIIFPSVKKIKMSEKKQYAVKISKKREYYIVRLSEESFFEFRKLYEDVLYPNSNVCLKERNSPRF
jgi:hypothetical protein